MTIPPLLTPTFWFSTTPPPFLPVVDKLILVVMAACVLVGAIAFLIRLQSGRDKLMKQALGRAGTVLVTTGLIGLLLYAFSYERVIYLSMRIWWLPLIAWFLWEAWKMYRFVFVKIPEIQKLQAERDQFEKWLPKKKK